MRWMMRCLALAHFAWGGLLLLTAERSAESGGGLLSPVAALPLALGVPVLILALCSIAAARTLQPYAGDDRARHNR